MSMKSSDYSCIPLCSDCHTRGPHAYHRIGREQFAQRHGMNLPEIAAQLTQLWTSKLCRYAALR